MNQSQENTLRKSLAKMRTWEIKALANNLCTEANNGNGDENTRKTIVVAWEFVNNRQGRGIANRRKARQLNRHLKKFCPNRKNICKF